MRLMLWGSRNMEDISIEVNEINVCEGREYGRY